MLAIRSRQPSLPPHPEVYFLVSLALRRRASSEMTAFAAFEDVAATARNMPFRSHAVNFLFRQTISADFARRCTPSVTPGATTFTLAARKGLLTHAQWEPAALNGFMRSETV